MPIFIAIAVFGLIYLLGSLIFSHEHDHDAGHDASHEHGDSDSHEGTVSVYSPKVVATLMMAFGVTGAFARYGGSEWPAASAYGLLSGLVFGALIWGLLSILYKQQANSLIYTASALGQIGSITLSVDPPGLGQIGLIVDGSYRTYDAQSASGNRIERGKTVKVTWVNGSILTVTDQIEKKQ